MFRVILVSHNQLAAGVKKAAEMIAGPQPQLEAYGLMPGEQPDIIIEQIRTTIVTSQNVLVLSDIVGGSMSNAAMSLLDLPNVRLVGGMNLALVLQVVLTPPETQEQLDHEIDEAQNNLHEIVIEKVKGEDDFF